MSIRRRAREIALHVLYQLEMGQEDPREALALTFQHFRPQVKSQEFCARLVGGVWQHREQIDRLIEENSEHWKLARMASVDRNILRIATFELIACPDIPFKATLNEAIELAKKFGSEDSGAFINGILDKIHSLSQAGAFDRPEQGLQR
jgi:N utilization substance protein B